MPMDPTLKAKWIRALRSGKYTQARDFFYNKGRYCCLGVLASVYSGIRGERILRLELESSKSILALQGEFSPSFCKKIGLPRKQQKRLIELNDLDTRSFNQIADWIEKYVK